MSSARRTTVIAMDRRPSSIWREEIGKGNRKNKKSTRQSEMDYATMMASSTTESSSGGGGDNKRPKLSSNKANVLMVGTGEYTTGYVGGTAADSDKGSGVVALTMFDLRRREKVDRVGMCGVNVSIDIIIGRVVHHCVI